MPIQQKPRAFKESGPETKERIVCGFSYLTMGMVGLGYYLFKGGKSVSSFFLFHFYQAILAGIFIFFVNMASQAFLEVMVGTVGTIPAALPAISAVGMGLGVVGKLLLLVLLYGAVMAFLGKQANIPGISNIARNQMR